jgi:hypothetical protein
MFTMVHYGLLGLKSPVLPMQTKVGLSFAAVTSTNTIMIAPIPLSWQRLGNNLVLSWSGSGFSLQAAPFSKGPFTNVALAVSPFTNGISGIPKYFRLKAN